MASNRARLFWQNGILLRDAWRHFATAADQKALDEMPRALDAMTKFASEHADGGLKAIADAVALGVRTRQVRREKEDQLREELLTDLFNAQIIATGFRERPSLSSAPVLIDAEHFAEGVADWEQSKFEANGRIWNRVRVSSPIEPTVRKVPNSGEAINSAIHALIEKNTEFAIAPRKKQCDLVRKEIGRTYCSGNGLSDQNIAKRIVGICGIKRVTKNSN